MKKCKSCRTKISEMYPFSICKRCRQANTHWKKNHRREVNLLNRLYRHRLKLKVLDHYGRKCTCCGETDFHFLTIDHIKGKHGNKKKESGFNFYLKLRKENFPKDYQVLCFSCNSAKGIYGICPHRIKEDGQ